MVRGMSPVVAADRGYVHCRNLGIFPDHLTGDMDSIPQEYLEEAVCSGITAVSRHSTDKDQTDSEIAVEIALQAGCDSIFFIGAFGERYDHMLANQMTAASLAEKGINCVLTDGVTYMYTVTPLNSPFSIKFQGAGKFRDVVSLVPVKGDFLQVDIEGLKYRLNNDRIDFGSQRAVSNTPVLTPGGEISEGAGIKVSNGVAFLIHTISD